MEVLVLGGTGFVGTHLCRELVDRSHEVTAVARNPETASLPDGVRGIHGDVTERSSLDDAMSGPDAVVNLVALSPLYRPSGGNRMHDVVHRGGTENAVRAAEETGVGRFVQLSGIYADPDAPTAYLRAKGVAEEIVRESALDWTIFRPTVAFGAGGEFRTFVKRVAPPYITPLPGGGRTKFQLMWVGDLVRMIADAVEGGHEGQTYEIGGPEVQTLAELATLIHAADGNPCTVVPIPMTLAGLGMRIGGLIPGFPLGPDQFEGLKMDLVARDNDVDAFGFDESELMTFEAFLESPPGEE